MPKALIYGSKDTSCLSAHTPGGAEKTKDIFFWTAAFITPERTELEATIINTRGS